MGVDTPVSVLHMQGSVGKTHKFMLNSDKYVSQISKVAANRTVQTSAGVTKAT